MGAWKNKLHYGDNLDVLREMPSELVDLVYLDPPFNSARNYNLLFKQHKGQDSPAQIMAFEDTWKWSHLEYQKFCAEPRNAPLHKLIASLYDILGDSEMMAYIVMMAPRLLELHRVLKPTGSLYLHCDPVASHYLKIVLDVIFGPQNFRNEIVWKRSDAHNDAKRQFARIGDRLLLYVKSQEALFKRIHTGFAEKTLKEWYRYLEFPDGTVRMMTREEVESQSVPPEARRFNPDNLRSPSPRPNLTYEYKGYKPHANGWAVSLEKMIELDEKGLLLFPASPDGRIMRKKYLDEQPGAVCGDIWADISMIRGHDKERRGYPTQKPLALLERIIAASSNEGDIVLDPFAGCGTAIVAAERMGRKWIGIDITFLAIAEVLDRLATEKVEGRELNYELVGTPKDAAGAAALFEQTKPQNHKPYEQFAVSLVKGKWNEKHGADRGIDGRIGMWTIRGEYREALIQVKGGNALTLSAVRDFRGTIEREKVVMGLIICQKEPTKEMLIEAEAAGYADWLPTNHYPRLQIRTMKDLLENPRNPFLFPEGSRIPPQQGVGKAVISGQMSFEDE